MKEPVKIKLEEAINLINTKKSSLNEEIIDELRAFIDISDINIILFSDVSNFEDLAIGNDVCIVNGDLTVNNLIEDCEGVDASLLIVLGNVSCKNLITLSSIFITGDLIVENVILGDSLCDYTLNVEGNIKTNTILDYGHSIISNKTITSNNIFSFNSIEDENGNLEETMTSNDLLDEISDVEYYEGDEDFEKTENLSKTIVYIKNGGTKFRN